MDEREVRLRIVEVMVPKASQVGIVKPETIVDSCMQLEKYVLGSQQGEDQPPPQPAKRRGRPPKETTEATSLQTSDPARDGG